jgi:hypothetical protein
MNYMAQNLINLVIGAGQLGSRHLQGLLRNPLKQKIIVIDPSRQALEVSQTRAMEIAHDHEIEYCVDWTAVPQDLDLVIVATNSMVREKIVEYLLRHFTARFLILEKVLFPELKAYDRVASLLENHKVKTWVNHPRRMFKNYRAIKNALQSVPFSFQVSGGNWGLGCNGLHFIDLCMFLTDSKIETIDAEWVDDAILPSKRNGFVEFTGTIKGKMQNGAMFQISSFENTEIPLTIKLSSQLEHWIIQENGGREIVNLQTTVADNLHKTKFESEYQSSLTTTVLSDLINKSDCLLTPFAQAMHAHQLFVSVLIEKYSKVTNVRADICPIT